MARFMVQLSSMSKQSQIDKAVLQTKQQAVEAGKTFPVWTPEKRARFVVMVFNTLYQKRLSSAFSQLVRFAYSPVDEEGLLFPGIIEDRKPH